jgi:hypothetical protein
VSLGIGILATAGGVFVCEEIKKRLLDKLFFSLPEEEQNRIIIEVIRGMNSQDNQKEKSK